MMLVGIERRRGHVRGVSRIVRLVLFSLGCVIRRSGAAMAAVMSLARACAFWRRLV
jgi:hypothetical protein